jgi:hypothetical protein
MNRIVGLETEYGCLTSTPAGSFIAVERVRDWIFGREEYGLIDVHHRDWDEPPGNGGFLFNGGRVYIDMGHLEYCTPSRPSVSPVRSISSATTLTTTRARPSAAMKTTSCAVPLL